MPREVLILADKKGKAWGFAEEIYNKLVKHPENSRNYYLNQVEIKKFNDGEIFCRVLNNVRGRSCFYIPDCSMYPQDALVSLIQVNDALKRSSAHEINNVIPYMNYSRQDRMTEPRVPISARAVADIISLYASRVITTDLHNPAIAGFYNIPFDNLKSFPVIIRHLQENYKDFLKNAVVVAPDIGSAKTTESYAKRLGLRVVLADKKREKAGVVSDMIIVGDVKGKNALVPDDLIATGGTLIKAAETLKKKGAKKIYACATHGVFSKGIRALQTSPLEKIIITDSIPKKNNHKKIETVSLRGLFAETIYRITHAKSVSQLFE
tara:strand:- start:84 stop:1049 length:966 start_codon:yes stop_codon:yes gene_type:complete